MSMPSSPSFSDFSCSGEPLSNWLCIAIIRFEAYGCIACPSSRRAWRCGSTWSRSVHSAELEGCAAQWLPGLRSWCSLHA